MANPKISVVIAAYNHEHYVGDALSSVLNQTFQDFELVVVDDGSTDGTGSVIKRYRADDSRINYIHQENQDAYNALNRGLRTASGEYIAVLNSDDVYAKTRLERLLDAQRTANAACLITDVQPIDERGREMTSPGFFWNAWHQSNRDFYFACGDLYTAFLHGNLMATSSNLFLTREAARQVGFFSAIRYLHDYDYIFRVMLSFPGRVLYLDSEKLLFYRLHGGNTLREGGITAREQDRQIIRKYVMARMPAELRDIVAAGTDRLIALEQELYEERRRSQSVLAPLNPVALLRRARQILR